MSRADYVIIGQGLAGSCMALELLWLGKSVRVIDHHDPNSASRVAAGMFNPITSKVRGVTWNADELFPKLDGFYRQAEKFTGFQFYHPMPVYRPFSTIEDQVGWSEVDTPYLRKVHFTSIFPDDVKDPYGGIELANSGYLDTRLFTEAVKQKLEHLGCMVSDEDVKDVNDELLSRLRKLGRRIIFCEGSKITENPFFKWLPVSKLKGEVLEVKTELCRDVIFNRSVYLVPYGDRFKAGSSYERTGIEGNTLSGVAGIEDKLGALLRREFQTVGKDWGFRPAVIDRRPVVGVHPDQNDLFVFNGMGTKGVSLAPWSAARMVSWLEGSDSLPDSLNISRFSSLYFKYLQNS